METGNRPNYDDWGAYDTLTVCEVAAMMRDLDPRAVAAGQVVVNDYGDTPDLSHEQRRLVSAILTGNLKSFPANPATPDSDTQIDVATLIPWLRAQRYIDLADGLEGSTKTLTTHSTGRTVAQLRLAGLLAIGGSANQVAGRGWKFTGIKELVATEKAAGKPRSDEKTIRRDLTSAAQEERDAKSAGATANWHAVKP